MENNKYYGGRDISGRWLTPDFTIESETICLTQTFEESPDGKQVIP